jgi:hypothetical protein
MNLDYFEMNGGEGVLDDLSDAARSTSTDQRLNTIHSLPIEGDGDAAEINIYARGTEIKIGGPRKSRT